MAKITIELNTQETSKAEAIAIIKGLCEIHNISIVSDLLEGVELENSKKAKAPIIELKYQPSDGPTETEEGEDMKQDGDGEAVDYLPKIRTLVKNNAKDHREAIQEKMAEFGAESVPKVPVKNHKELYEFLVKLS